MYTNEDLRTLSVECDEVMFQREVQMTADSLRWCILMEARIGCKVCKRVRTIHLRRFADLPRLFPAIQDHIRAIFPEIHMEHGILSKSEDCLKMEVVFEFDWI